jgi:hypothetical protein
MEACDIIGGSVTLAPTRFMNACLFKKWLSHFHSAVPETTKSSLILVCMDWGNSSKEENMLSGFEVSRILPLNLTARLQHGGVHLMFNGFYHMNEVF